MSSIYSLAPYDPEDIDLAWARQVLSLLREDSTLVFPSTQLIYAVSHKEKRLILLNETLLDDSESAFLTHSRTIEVFRQAAGYDVIPGWEELRLKQGGSSPRKPNKGTFL